MTDDVGGLLFMLLQFDAIVTICRNGWQAPENPFDPGRLPSPNFRA